MKDLVNDTELGGPPTRLGPTTTTSSTSRLVHSGLDRIKSAYRSLQMTCIIMGRPRAQPIGLPVSVYHSNRLLCMVAAGYRP